MTPESQNCRDSDRRPAREPGRDLALPIAEKPRHFQAGKWRSISLALVHVFMVGHLIHWAIAGSTLSPVEPSEAMETIRRGVINPGFLFFAAALLATLLLGRWVCGWGCHFIAYQDLTLWLLKKLHLRPKAFRTRIMIYIPLVIAAGWMFLVPLGHRLWRATQGAPGPEFTTHWTQTGYWDTFPILPIAILSALVCGVAIIYFLGPKGFCTYGCPYGAFFAIADKVAPGRIRVTDACQHCGKCTAACTSNVSVAEEVKLYGTVVDPGCMKCLDCVTACPTEALYFGLGKPALGAKPASPRKTPRYDLTLGEELVAIGVFLVCLVSVNGLYGQYPFLLSLGTACILMFVIMKAVHLAYRRDVRLQKIKLKIAGRIKPLGIAYLIATTAVVALVGHSAVWRYHDILGRRAFTRSPSTASNWPYDPRLRERADEASMEQVAVALHHLRACERWGFLPSTPNDLQRSWLSLFSDEPSAAADTLRRVLARRPDSPGLWLKLARIETHLGRRDAAKRAFEKAIALETVEREALTRKAGAARHPVSSNIWLEWGIFQARMLGDPKAALASFERAGTYDARSTVPILAVADLHLATGDAAAARRALLDAMKIDGNSPPVVGRLDALRMRPQDFKSAADDYSAALEADPQAVVLLHNLAYALAMSGRPVEATATCRKALAITPDAIHVRATLGGLLYDQNDLPGAIGEYEVIHRNAPTNAEAAIRLGILYVKSGRAEEGARLFTEAARHGNSAQRRAAEDLLRRLEAPSP